jgi:ABC-type multidrug transport system fused ATPase/permease subunit
MEQGRIVERGSHDELMGTSQRFRSLAATVVGQDA